VVNQTFDLFDRLGATDEQLDFTVVYASALNGYAGMDSEVRSGDMTPLFQTIVDKVSPPPVDLEGPFQMRVTSLDYNNYVGIIGVGRIQRGKVRTNQTVTVIDRDGRTRNGRVLQVMGFMGLERIEVPEAQAGDIVAVSGIEALGISETICDPAAVEQLPVLTVDEPTISMTFQVNDSPFAGHKDRSGGRFLTSRQLRDRLTRETQHNVALKVEDTADADKLKVSGRGELHLSILIENMRREGYELAVSRPEVIIKELGGVLQEPYEQLVVDLEEPYQGGVMSRLGERKALLQNMEPDGKGRVRMEFIIPARGLIGFQTEFRTLTAGTGLLFHVFDHYGPKAEGAIGQRQNGVLISNDTGTSTAYAQFAMQERGRLLIEPQEEIYEGQIVGIHAKDNDLTVNALRAKQLTNFRAAGKDDALALTPPIKMSLEQALEFIDDDELVEVTPKAIRLRKKLRGESDRKRASRAA
jgi:GTP-binding protein